MASNWLESLLGPEFPENTDVSPQTGTVHTTTAAERKLSGWLPTLLGPLDFQNNGSSFTPRRQIWNFTGAVTVIDRPDEENPIDSYTEIRVGGGSDGVVIVNDGTGQLDDVTTEDDDGSPADVIVFTGGGVITVTGFQGGTPGRRLQLVTMSADTVIRLAGTTTGESDASADANRMRLSGSGGGTIDYVTFGGYEVRTLVYNGGNSRWQVDGMQPPPGEEDDVVGLDAQGNLKSLGPMPAGMAPGGSTGDVQIKASSTTLSGVSPGTAGKVLVSNGSAWTSGAPGSNGDAIVRSGGVLAGVAPGAAGNVFTSDGSAWVSQAPATQVLGTWVTVYDVDFTSLVLSSASGNGNFTIDGKTWTVANFAKASNMSVGGTDGLRIKCTTSSSSMAAGTNSSAYFMSPPLTTLLPALPDDVRVGLRFSFYVKGFTRSVTNDALCLMLCDPTLDGTRFEFEQFYSGSAQTDYMRLYLNSSLKVNTSIAATLTSPSTHDCIQLEFGQVGIDIPNIFMTGIYSAGWPSKWYRRAQLSAAAGQFLDTKIKELSDARLVIAQLAASAAGTSEVKIGRMRVEAYRYQ